MSLLAVSMIATRWPWLVLGAGVLSLSVALLVMMRTRWGHARPLSKCAVLSVWAHLMLLGFASLTNWWVDPPRRAAVQTIRVSWIDSEPVDDRPEEDVADEDPEDASSIEMPLATVEGATAPPVDEPSDETAGAPDLLPAPEPTPESTSENSDSEKDASPALASMAHQEDEAPPSSPVESLDAKRSEDPAHLAGQLPDLPTTQLEDDSLKRAASDRYLSLSADESAELFQATATSPDTKTQSAVVNNDANRALTPLPKDLRNDPSSRQSSAHALPAIYQGRNPADRKQRVLQANGSPDAEQAVQAGLDWLASAQDRRTGGWSTEQWGGGREVREFSDAAGSINADTALTGLALLAFLGSGYTHQEGPYQETVQRGLEFLIAQQSSETGSLAGSAGRYVSMYCHGMATFALSETLVMSGDERLREPVRRAIEWTVRAQHPSAGGWRYEVGDVGDTSQFGWQVMAMVSARAAGIEAPAATWQRADRWLDRVALGSHGGLACYVPDQRRPTPSMTAEAAACRFFLHSGMPPEAWSEASKMIVSHGPSWQGTLDLYYCYYATLAIYLAQDPKWPAWNERLTRDLLRHQQATGTLAGSWDTRTRWGAVGGRVYTTSMACLCLETCYRYLPVYRVAQSSDTQWRRSDR